MTPPIFDLLHHLGFTPGAVALVLSLHAHLWWLTARVNALDRAHASAQAHHTHLATQENRA